MFDLWLGRRRPTVTLDAHAWKDDDLCTALMRRFAL
jgi:hypothetical protein